MKLDLTDLFDNPGISQDFDTKMDLSDVKRWGNPIFGSLVSVKGHVEKRSGIVSIKYAVDFMLQAVCDRCLTDISRQEHMEFSHILVFSLNREDDGEFIVIPDGKLDLAELTASDILLELPTAMVCDQGCKGLCPICGKNRNLESCNCRQEKSGRGLEILRDLLDD